MKPMEGMLDKYGAYINILKMCWRMRRKKSIKLLYKEKKRKLLEATTLCCTAFFLDNLETAKMFSLVSQKKDINILTITDILEDTRS